jgi:probable rRNA maturation factor
VQIIIKNQQKIIPVNKKAAKAIALKTLTIFHSHAKIFGEGGGANLRGELTVVFVDNKAIQKLNYRFLGKRQPTDVLCFDLSEKGRFLADIVISAQRAKENSRAFNTSPLKEVNLYLIHGILHLFGYNHRRNKDRIRMQRKALQILRSINIKN